MSRIWRSMPIIGLLFMASSCGRKGALIYPDMLVPAEPAAVSALQSGAAVKLQFALPDKDRAGRPVQGVAGVKISRKAFQTVRKDVCRSCMTDYILLNTLYLDHLPANTQRFGNRLVVLDRDVRAGNTYSYRIIPFTATGVDGATSPPADAPVDTIIPPPVLRIESLPTELKLQFSLPTQITARQLGYNLYRSTGATPRSYQPLNRVPLKGDEYVDSAVERGVKYRYSARVLVVRGPGDIAESAESDEVEGMLKEDE